MVLKDLSENSTGLLMEFGSRRLVDSFGNSIELLGSAALLTFLECSSSDVWDVYIAFVVPAGSF